ncbi:MAG: formyltransferase family protein [Thermoanaerobaculia bacterium]
MLTSRPRVAVLCSRRCPGLESLLAGHHRDFELAGCLISDGGLPDRRRLEAARVPVRDHPIRAFYGGHPLSDFRLRRDYDRASVGYLRAWRPDVVLLSSYLYLLTDPVLEAFPERIANVHGSDLTLKAAGGHPLYAGLRAVRDAIRAGELETRATAHIVTERLDEGPILLRSRSFPVAPLVAELRRRGLARAVDAYAFAHQEWMLEAAWGPLLTGAIALMNGRIERLRNEFHLAPANRPGTIALAGVRP